MKARRTRLSLFYDGVDISRDIARDLITFEWTDNESDKADDITVKLKDDQGLWHGPWYPAKGDTLQATIIDERDDSVETLYCGRFQIDDLTFSGPPNVFELKGASVPLEQSIRREHRSRAWEDVSLEQIVERIAARGALTALYEVDKEHRYDRIDQRQESDLAFLQRICGEEGYSLKVTDNQLVVFDQAEYETRPPLGTLVRGSSDILSWSFDSQAYDLYSECTCAYYDPTTETYLERTFTDPNIVGGMSYKLLRRAASLAEAERLAKGELRKRNKHEVTGRLVIRGGTQWVAGVTVTVSGFGVYDGKYMIEESTHSVGNGYTCTLTVRRVLEGY